MPTDCTSVFVPWEHVKTGTRDAMEGMWLDDGRTSSREGKIGAARRGERGERGEGRGGGRERREGRRREGNVKGDRWERGDAEVDEICLMTFNTSYIGSSDSYVESCQQCF